MVGADDVLVDVDALPHIAERREGRRHVLRRWDMRLRGAPASGLADAPATASRARWTPRESCPELCPELSNSEVVSERLRATQTALQSQIQLGKPDS